MRKFRYQLLPVGFLMIVLSGNAIKNEKKKIEEKQVQYDCEYEFNSTHNW